MGFIFLGAVATVVAVPQIPVDHAVFAADTVPRRIDFRLVAAPPAPALQQRHRLRLAVEDGPDRSFERIDLVSIDREAGRTGTIVRHPHLTAGLSLRLVGGNGSFAPDLGMAGAAGRALERLAIEADAF